MAIWNQFPRRGYVREKTPLEELPRISRELGCRIRIKRDDLLPYGGNKTRKLDYLMACAVEAKADAVICTSTFQCCNNSILALLAAREGMSCGLVMENWGDPSYTFDTAANREMLQLCGVRNVAILSEKPMVPMHEIPVVAQMAEEMKAQGKKPYLIPRGGSGALGSIGYIICAQELIEQWGRDEPEAVICPCGTGGTQAGLIVGLYILGSAVPVIGIGVTGKTKDMMEADVFRQCEEICRLIEVPCVPREKVACLDDYRGNGYAQPTAQQVQWMSALASMEGILTDPVYSGKAFWGGCELARRAKVPGKGGLMFLHTGGLHLFYDYSAMKRVVRKHE